MTSTSTKPRLSTPNSALSLSDRNIGEILDRVTRIETILYKLSAFMGMDARTGEEIDD